MYRLVGYIKVDLGSLKHGRHQPYMLGVLILGPKNGMYLLDTYGTYLLLNNIIKDKVGLRNESIILELGLPYRTIHYAEETEEATCKKVAKTYGWKYYTRSKVAPKVNIFANNFDTEMVDKIHKVIQMSV